MSFILDALKKSEREREQQARGSQPEIVYKRRSTTQPLWMLAVTGLLVLNFIFVLVLWLRGDRQQAVPMITVNSGTATSAPTANALPPMNVQPNNAAVSSAASTPANVRPLQEEVYPPASEPADETSKALANADLATGPQLVRSINQDAANNLSTDPASNPGLAAAINKQNAARPNSDNVPTLDSLGGNGALNLPPMHLDIHVYSSAPAERFVFINMRKYTEGQSLNEGPLLERIGPEGAVLSYRGQRFLLPRQ